MSRKQLMLLVLMVLQVAGVRAADEAGRFAVRNAGMSTCDKFLEEKEKRSPALNLYMGWIDGYISAANQFTKENFDLIAWGNTPFLATLLENHCRNHPVERFYVAVNKLVASLSSGRLKTHSELIETRHQDKKTYLYQSVLLDVQQRLKNEGHYTGAPDGVFDDETRLALEKYQKAKNIQVTGLPDQLTLYLIYGGKVQ